MKTTRYSYGLALSLSLSLLSAQAVPTGTPLITPEYMTVLRNGDVGKLREALDHGASPKARDGLGTTALMHSAIYGDVDCMRLLLQRGAEVNATNAAGATALMRAALDADKVSLLLENGADVQARSALGNTALILAARPWNSHAAVELLLAHGADAKATNNWGANALMAAAAGGDVESAQLLLKHGADPNAQPGTDHVAFIFGGARNPLMWAAYRGNLPLLKLLIEAGADVNAAGMLGTPLSQAAWANHTKAARLLIEHGAQANQAGQGDGYTALHWAASTEHNDPALVNLLLKNGADPNLGGGANVDAFMGTLQTPLMLARRRGDTAVVASLVAAGATNATIDRVPSVTPPDRVLPQNLDNETVRSALKLALAPLQATSLESKAAFVKHASHQDCTSCHQQYLPMAAIGLAKKQRVEVDAQAEEQLIKMVGEGELKNVEIDLEPVFHPDPVFTKGYELFAFAAEDLPATPNTDAWVHHLSAVQGRDGQWHNNIPRPPIQTDDVGATALAVQGLRRYALPGRKGELAVQVERARRWLWTVQPDNHESRIYQILGLAWAGEPARNLEKLTQALLAEQRADGGWSQLPGTKSDAYATGQALYALRVGAALQKSHPAVDRGMRYLLRAQLDDGTWYVHRRTFPFQPTMDSGFPHGRDSWISAAASSWAVMALSLPDEGETLALRRDAGQ